MSSAIAIEPLELDADQLERGKLKLEGSDPAPEGGDAGGGGSGKEPPSPPPGARRRRPERPPRWPKLALAGCFLIMGLLSLWLSFDTLRRV